MRKMRLPRSLNEATCMMTDSGLQHEHAADEHAAGSPAWRARRRCRCAAPSASEPTSPMNTSAGWELNQRKPRPAPDQRAAEDGQLARPGT